MIARPRQRHRDADGLDDARSLMAQDDWQWVGQRALDDFQVGVTETAGTQAHQDVVRAKGAERDALDGKRPTYLVQDGGAEVHDAAAPPTGTAPPPCLGRGSRPAAS